MQRKITATEPESPQHDVHVRTFLMDRFEVTAMAFREYLAASGHPDFDVPGADDHPVVSITWDQARAYCQYRGKNLPTEAQWESAARGSDQQRFPWGANVPDAPRANFCDSSCESPWRLTSHDDGFSQTAPAGSYPGGTSRHGIHDLAGNVSEWVLDWYDPRFYLRKEAKVPNPMNDESTDSKLKVVRGGSWKSDLFELRSAYRHFSEPDSTSATIGFRCAAPEEISTRIKIALYDLGVLR